MAANTCPTRSARIGMFVSTPFRCQSCDTTLEYVRWRVNAANGIAILGSLLAGDFLVPRGHPVLLMVTGLGTCTVLCLLAWRILVRLHAKAPERQVP